MMFRSIREIKTNTKRNDFFMFGFIVKNIKENKKFSNFKNIFKFFSPYII